MNHAPATIARIKELLSKAGLKNKDLVEELVDHYLTDIECQVDQKIDEEVAIQTTCEKIVKTDLRRLQNKNKSWYITILIAVIALVLLTYHFTQPKGAIQPPSKAMLTQLEPEPDGWPVGEFTSISSHFGMRTHPIFKKKVQHKGIDIKAPHGANVLATGDAIVIKVGQNKNAGKLIILQHNPTYSTKYYHLSNILIKEGDRVQKGDVIGKVGNTGMSSTPHLHYEIIEGDGPVDPLDCIKA